MDRPYVLLIENSPDDQHLIKYAIGRSGIDVDLAVADDGQDAINMLFAEGARRPDLILTDWHMPKLGGGDVLRELRDSSLADVPVAVLLGSSREDFRHKEECYDCLFIEKAMEVSTTVENVNKVLRQVLSPPA